MQYNFIQDDAYQIHLICHDTPQALASKNETKYHHAILRLGNPGRIFEIPGLNLNIYTGNSNDLVNY